MRKGNLQYVKNYRPVSSPPVFSKMFERLIDSAMCKHFLANYLIFCNQSGFKSGDSCINQLTAITHEIFKDFNGELEVRGVFLISSKHLTKNGMSDVFKNYAVMIFMAIYDNYCYVS